MKKIAILVILAIIVILSSCGNESTPVQTELDSESVQTELESTDVQAELASKDFIFLSGAGAWRTLLTINEDGSFSGEFIDDDMGINTRYYSSFTGEFTDIQKENEYSYKMKVKEINYKNTPDTEETIDGILIKYSTAYGLAGTEYVYLILPGTPISTLPEGFINYAKAYFSLDESELLEGYALYNPSKEYVFAENVD